MTQKRTSRSGSGGFKSALLSMISLIVLVSAVFGWAKVNNIHTAGDVLTYLRTWTGEINDCGASEGKWNCDVNLKPGSSSSSNSSNSGNSSDSNSTADSKNSYLQNLEKVSISESQKVDYKRSEWKHWVGTPCDARKQTLINQGRDVKTGDNCKILSGTWVDPYAGETFTEASKLDIDHVIPLSYAAQHGGQDWSSDKKQQFANDLSQLIAASASENRSKSDKGPSEYMPRREFQCQYSKIWVDTALKYGVSITEKDKYALKDGLQKC
jgi:hypothetical protein